MRPHRGDRLASAVTLFVTTAACANANGLGRADAPHVPEHQARAPAVALEPHARLPQATTTSTTGSGLAVLSEPHNGEAAREVIRRFFQAVVAEDWPALQALVDSGAQITADSRGTRWQALTFWRLRFNKLDYTQLSGRIVFQDSAIETYAAQDLPLLSSFRTLPVVLEPQQLLVRVPIETMNVDGLKLLGDQMSFVLAPVGSTYTIFHIIEPFSMP